MIFVLVQELLSAAKLGLRFQQNDGGLSGGVMATVETAAVPTKAILAPYNSWLASAFQNNTAHNNYIHDHAQAAPAKRQAHRGGWASASSACGILEVDATHQLPSSQELRAYFEHGFPVIFRNLLSGLGCRLGKCPAQASAVPASLRVRCLP